MKRNKLLLLGSAAFFLVAMMILIPLRAETNNKEESSKRKSRLLKADEETVKLIKTIQVWKLVTNVSLSEEQLISVLPVFDEQEKLKWKFRRDKYRLVEELKAIDKDDKVSDAQLKKAVDEYNKIEDRFAKTMNELDDKLMSKLTPKQQVKYILFKDSYHRDLRQTLLKIRELGKEENRSVPSRSSRSERR